MPLKPLSTTEALTVLHETRTIWSAGLKVDDYYDYNDMQRQDSWGRRNLRLYGYETSDGQIAASLKLHQLTMMSRGREYSCCGVTAIYSRQKFRGRGFGGKIVQAVIEKAHQEGHSALLLFSDIGLEFYEQYGFNEIGTLDLEIVIDQEHIDHGKLSGVAYEVVPLFQSDFDLLARHHRRWLRRRPFGISRSQDYFAYKARKENFLNLHSRLSWPMLQVIAIQAHNEMAYAIYEIGGANLRVLELVSAPTLHESIWQAIFLEALKHKIKRIKSWESNILELSPGFSLKSFLLSTVYKQDFAPTIYYSQRSWGKVMLLPLDNNILPWLRSFPSPILEFDHL